MQRVKANFLSRWCFKYIMFKSWSVATLRETSNLEAHVSFKIVETTSYFSGLRNGARSIAKTCTIGCMLDLDVTWANAANVQGTGIYLHAWLIFMVNVGKYLGGYVRGGVGWPLTSHKTINYRCSSCRLKNTTTVSYRNRPAWFFWIFWLRRVMFH